jgi:peptide-methionine (S)-S-oxide reductase
MITSIARPAARAGLNRLLAVALLTVFPLWVNAAEQKSTPPKTRLATLGGGCFWCLEAFYETFNGIVAVTSGYAGGQVANPTYEQVCSGGTGHAEVVQIEFDPSKISYETLLEIFWEMHDPTTLNRQGADVGTQYRSIILPHDEAQMQAALKSKQAAQARFKDPITTEIVPLKKFYPAEEYHQDYYRKNPRARYCVYVINPKLEKLRKLKARIEK